MLFQASERCLLFSLFATRLFMLLMPLDLRVKAILIAFAILHAIAAGAPLYFAMPADAAADIMPPLTC